MTLEEITNQVSLITDRLGLGIDEEIKKAVIACNFVGFTTTMSCAGHLNIHGTPYPWIEIEGIDSIHRMQLLLNEFYQNHNKDNDHIRIISYSSDYRLQFDNIYHGPDMVPIYKRDAKFLSKTRNEMDSFAEFLITKVK